MITFNIKDSLRAQVESASGGRNTVVYTAKGQPCFMYVFPRFNVEDIDPQLGTGVHPAFIVGGVEKSELIIGMYPGYESNGELVSVPGVEPLNMINFNNSVSLCRANGPGWHLKTNVEHAALALWCLANQMPRGNDDQGRSTDVPAEHGTRSDGLAPGAPGSARTLTGSGPTSWRHDRTPYGISDLAGNVWEWSPGMRINSGEIQIIADNDAAMDGADFDPGSAQWRSIDGASGALVEPGHTNAVRYVNALSGTDDYALYCLNNTSFTEMQNSTGPNPVSEPAIQLLRQLSVYPIAGRGDLGGDHFWINDSADRPLARGGNFTIGSRSGAFALALNYARPATNQTIGARPAFVI